MHVVECYWSHAIVWHLNNYKYNAVIINSSCHPYDVQPRIYMHKPHHQWPISSCCFLKCIQLDTDDLHDLNVRVDWTERGGAYWVGYIHLDLNGERNVASRSNNSGNFEICEVKFIYLLHWNLYLKCINDLILKSVEFGKTEFNTCKTINIGWGNH